jgi:hypothetical protein
MIVVVFAWRVLIAGSMAPKSTLYAPPALRSLPWESRLRRRYQPRCRAAEDLGGLAIRRDVMCRAGLEKVMEHGGR